MTALQYKGNFLEFFIVSFLIFLIGFPTLGLAWLYLPYWQVKYFIEHTHAPTNKTPEKKAK